jgi:hypothetical protein
LCMGIVPPPELLANRQKAIEDGTTPCACICPDDRIRCSEVP